MYTENKIWMAQSDKRLYLLPSMANRHGLIAGATGTGKTITMKVMAEQRCAIRWLIPLQPLPPRASSLCPSRCLLCQPVFREPSSPAM